MNAKTTLKTTMLCVMIRMTVELTWFKEELYTTSCEGQDKLLMLNYSTEENEKVIQTQWFYKKTKQICYYSESTGFIISSSYVGRVEQRGTKGILLTKVSALDTGEYTFYPKLAGEHTQNIQTMFLTVYETPTYQCKPNITVHSKNIISCLTNSCGGQQLLPEWRIFGERDPVGNESYLKVISSWHDKLALCCPKGPNMMCHNRDPFMFCASTFLDSTHKDKYIKEASTDRDGENMVSVVMITVFVLLAVVIVTLVALVCLWIKVRSHQQWLRLKLTEAIPVMNNVHINSDIFKDILDYDKGFQALRQGLVDTNILDEIADFEDVI